MGNVIRVKLWDSVDRSASDRLTALVGAMDGWPSLHGPWHRFIERDERYKAVGVSTQGTMDSAELLGLLGQAGASRHVSTGAVYCCQRFSGDHVSSGSIPLSLSSWPAGYMRRDRRLDGDAALVFDTVGPFCALLKPDAPPQVNKSVEKNLENLFELLLHLVEELSPKSVKAYTDVGTMIPINAHIAYFRDESDVLADLSLLQLLWNEGFASYNIPPLASLEPTAAQIDLHSWRSPAQRDRLYRALAELIQSTDRVTEDDVRAALAGGRHDFFQGRQGWMVLEYPHAFNAFLDRFYLDVLRGAAHASTTN